MKIAALFFADDGMILLQSLEGTERAIRILTETETLCGLNINKQKSNIIIYNEHQEYQNETENIQVVDSVKYLGSKITNKRNCFEGHKNDCLKKG